MRFALKAAVGRLVTGADMCGAAAGTTSRALRTTCSPQVSRLVPVGIHPQPPCTYPFPSQSLFTCHIPRSLQVININI
ncbi:hypothetical protein BDZ91DRAFT_383509 [Kalaharituber pfeilii]|nr:hypothetical protein BDZ91DRAFT_383509 [Kalaharituber pfeilii]